MCDKSLIIKLLNFIHMKQVPQNKFTYSLLNIIQRVGKEKCGIQRVYFEGINVRSFC